MPTCRSGGGSNGRTDGLGVPTGPGILVHMVVSSNVPFGPARCGMRPGGAGWLQLDQEITCLRCLGSGPPGVAPWRD